MVHQVLAPRVEHGEKADPRAEVLVIGGELLHRLAMGGMAELYVARHSGIQGFERTVVVKRVLPNLTEDPEFISMFLDEARLAARIHHPNVVSTMDVQKADDADRLVGQSSTPSGRKRRTTNAKAATAVVQR